MTSEPGPRGCYGLRITGCGAGERLLSPAPPGQPHLAVEQVAHRPEEPGEVVPLVDGGELFLDAPAGLARYRFGEPVPDGDLVHPWLAPAAIRRSLALGRLVLHGGLLQVGDHAVAVIGDREAGKSTLVAHAAFAGRPVLSDDVVVVADGQAFAGPRCVDLRSGSAPGWDLTRLEPSRGGERRRLVLDAAPWSLPLGAIVTLGWGPEQSARSKPGAERLRSLGENLACPPTPAGRAAAVGLVGVPAFEVTRPRDLAGLDATLDLLDSLLG